MSERVVVLRVEQPLQFLVDACAALADAVNEPHAWRSSDAELLAVYAESVSTLARIRLAEHGDAGVPTAIIEHLIERLRQARTGEIATPVADVIDRLHAEAVSELTTV